jgi:lambda repressor-like predicted transcriptional regulator
MEPIDIQYELKKRGITQTEIAKQLDLSPMTISNVVNKHVVSDRVMRAVAAAINRDRRLVFPEYYLSPAKRATSKVAPIA